MDLIVNEKQCHVIKNPQDFEPTDIAIVMVGHQAIIFAIS